ncbi:MAG: bifunctional UDP-sugar hydrolase/5'-nucleotidase [Gammaproteobacteria bacterium]
MQTMPHIRKLSYVRKAVAICLAMAVASCASNSPKTTDNVTLSVIGTNDVHGQLLPGRFSGGMDVFSGYLNAVRSARQLDDGGFLLIDAGDMWQGTLESNLSEGSVMVETYNALGYDAATIGNHEFDFGPVGERSTPSSPTEDPRGAIKARATEADFPLLAANLIDSSTGRAVNWPNVQPSIMVNAAGVKVGIIGVMTSGALAATIAANVGGLSVAPLAEMIEQEARELREQGAKVIIVTAHAGGSCGNFDDPYDLSSCNPDDEIMRVARALPKGLVDQMIAGHHHRGIAHFVNGIAVTASYSSGRSFGRVDYTLDRNSGEVLKRNIFPPRRICPFIETVSGKCAWVNDPEKSLNVATYENRDVTADPKITAILDRARSKAQELKARKLGVYLATPLTLENRPEAALGHLMTDALLETSTADVSLHNVSGGIRANLTAGELTFGKVYQMFPFDNRVVLLNLTGADMRKVIAKQAHKEEKRAGFSGMSAYVQCDNNQMKVTLRRKDGSEIYDTDVVKLAVNDFLALGGDNILSPVLPENGFAYPSDTPLARDMVVKWLTEKGGTLTADQFLGEQNRRWHMPDSIPSDCKL